MAWTPRAVARLLGRPPAPGRERAAPRAPVPRAHSRRRPRRAREHRGDVRGVPPEGWRRATRNPSSSASRARSDPHPRAPLRRAKRETRRRRRRVRRHQRVRGGHRARRRALRGARAPILGAHERPPRARGAQATRAPPPPRRRRVGRLNVGRNPLLGYFMIHDVYEETMAVLVAPVDVPGGGVSSVTFQGATALLMKREGGGDGGGDERGGGARDEGGGGRRRRRKLGDDEKEFDEAVGSIVGSSTETPSGGPALGTTAERTRLRAEAAALSPSCSRGRNRRTRTRAGSGPRTRCSSRSSPT